MNIEDLDAIMTETSKKTGRYCCFKLATPVDGNEDRRFESYIASYNDDEVAFIKHPNIEEAVKRFESYCEDSTIEIKQRLLNEKQRLELMVREIDLKLTTYWSES